MAKTATVKEKHTPARPNPYNNPPMDVDRLESKLETYQQSNVYSRVSMNEKIHELSQRLDKLTQEDRDSNELPISAAKKTSITYAPMDLSNIWWDGFTWGMLAFTALLGGMMLVKAHRKAQLSLER